MPNSLWSSFQNLYYHLHNQVDYPLRQLFRWRRNGLQLRRGPARELFAHLPPGERARAEAIAISLRDRYHLAELAQDSSPANYRENLFYLAMLETALEQSGAMLPVEVRAADIGPSHWFYVQALYALLRWGQGSTGRAVSLTGYEVDAFRVYGDLYSRYDHALAHMRGLPGVEYRPVGFERQPGRYDWITMLFPFVFQRDHLEWGLPGPMFRPDRLLAAAWSSLKPGGVLVVVNQGEAEHAAQREQFRSLGIPVQAAFRQDPLLYAYDLDRYVLVARYGS